MQVRPARPSEYDEALTLVEQAFPPGDGALVIAAATIRQDPRFRPEHLRVVERDGRIVGMVGVIDRLVHIGSALARCAIIAPLATGPAYQGSGVGSALMRDTLEWARANGFHLSMLWGHTWLYPRYGYAPGIKSYAVAISAQAQPLGDKAYALRPYSAADAPALRQVYQAETATTSLAEVRSDEPWEWRPHSAQTRVEVAVDPAGAIRGYLRAKHNEQQLRIDEIAALDTGAAQALYDRALYLGREQAATEIHVTAPPNNRWSRLAFMRGAQVRIGSGGGAGMVRLLDLPSFLQAIQPELERRVAASEFVAKRADIRIETPVGRATVRLDHGQVAIDETRSASSITLPFHALGPLIAGYQPIDELLGLPGVFLRGAGRERLLDVLFPEGYPHWPFAAYFD
jgi:predicted N-acetyltransferase YhbS